MPYPFAHPAAVIPLARPMGRFAVASALVIGSVVPDVWYLVPSMNRAHTHSALALVWFCLPAGLLAYAVFHLFLKQPLIALVSSRLGAYSSDGLPRVAWYAVAASLFAGAATHLAWDLLTHSEDHAIQGFNWPQHASTVIGTLVIAWWTWRKLRAIPAREPQLSMGVRIAVFALLAGVAAAAAFSVDGPGSTRQLLRAAAVAGFQALALAIFVYCAVWHFRTRRLTSA